jgi:hypothetical protein
VSNVFNNDSQEFNFIYYIIQLVFSISYIVINLFYPLPSMTSIADANDKWASFAGPGAWNGN